MRDVNSVSFFISFPPVTNLDDIRNLAFKYYSIGVGDGDLFKYLLPSWGRGVRLQASHMVISNPISLTGHTFLSKCY